MSEEKDGEKDDISRVSCSCMGVEYSPIRNEDGSFTERWACKDCGNQFVKIQFLKELRTRVAELTKKGENLCTSHGLLLCAHDTLKKKNEELQNRLSQAEEKEKELRENWLEDMQEWSVEKATLLKASEGMEKALELLINHTMDCEEDIDKLSGMGNDSGSGSSEYVCAAKQALADFRAVKETK